MSLPVYPTVYVISASSSIFPAKCVAIRLSMNVNVPILIYGQGFASQVSASVSEIHCKFWEFIYIGLCEKFGLNFKDEPVRIDISDVPAAVLIKMELHVVLSYRVKGCTIGESISTIDRRGGLSSAEIVLLQLLTCGSSSCSISSS
jgi:hypothetical protein